MKTQNRPKGGGVFRLAVWGKGEGLRKSLFRRESEAMAEAQRKRGEGYYASVDYVSYVPGMDWAGK